MKGAAAVFAFGLRVSVGPGRQRATGLVLGFKEWPSSCLTSRSFSQWVFPRLCTGDWDRGVGALLLAREPRVATWQVPVPCA